MLRNLSAHEWEEWLEFYALEPFGPQADDLRHGMLCASVLAPHFKRGSAPDPRDYMLRAPPERELSAGETEAALDVLLGVRAPPERVRAPEES